MPNRVLITGGAGFIGSNLAAYYLGKGWEVIVYDNLSRKGSEWNVTWLASLGKPNLTVVTGDIRHYEGLCKAASGADVIYHLAAQVAVTTSVENPREDFMARPCQQVGLSLFTCFWHFFGLFGRNLNCLVI